MIKGLFEVLVLEGDGLKLQCGGGELGFEGGEVRLQLLELLVRGL